MVSLSAKVVHVGALQRCLPVLRTVGEQPVNATVLPRAGRAATGLRATAADDERVESFDSAQQLDRIVHAAANSPTNKQTMA